VSGPLYLRNDDDPGRFTSRKIGVLARVRVGGKDGVLVSLQPPLEVDRGWPLATVILISRDLDDSVEDLWRGAVSTPRRVWVCRIKQERQGIDSTKQEYTWDEVSGHLWGRVENKKYYKSYKKSTH
jgi:hypothetical protein